MYKINRYRNRIPKLDYPIKLDLGAGQHPKPGFIRMDFDPNGADICWDACDGIPVPNDSVEYLFTCHFLEHLLPTDLHYVLQEMMRVCQNGAIIEIWVPHGDTPEGALPAHYVRLDEKFMEGLDKWYLRTWKLWWEVQEIKRVGIHLIATYKVVKQ